MSVQRIQIASKIAAKRIADAAEYPIGIISITSPNDDLVSFSSNPSITAIFRMQFNDLEQDWNAGMQAPWQKDFNGLKEFLDIHCQNCDMLLIHCDEGVSRSAAVGAAINEYLHLEQKIWGQQQYAPNRLVYRMACVELGITPIIC